MLLPTIFLWLASRSSSLSERLLIAFELFEGAAGFAGSTAAELFRRLSEALLRIIPWFERLLLEPLVVAGTERLLCAEGLFASKDFFGPNDGLFCPKEGFFCTKSRRGRSAGLRNSSAQSPRFVDEASGSCRVERRTYGRGSGAAATFGFTTAREPGFIGKLTARRMCGTILSRAIKGGSSFRAALPEGLLGELTTRRTCRTVRSRAVKGGLPSELLFLKGFSENSRRGGRAGRSVPERSKEGLPSELLFLKGFSENSRRGGRAGRSVPERSKVGLPSELSFLNGFSENSRRGGRAGRSRFSSSHGRVKSGSRAGGAARIVAAEGRRSRSEGGPLRSKGRRSRSKPSRGLEGGGLYLFQLQIEALWLRASRKAYGKRGVNFAMRSVDGAADASISSGASVASPSARTGSGRGAKTGSSSAI